MERQGVFKSIRDRFCGKPRFPETPKGYTRYYSGWNLRAFETCFDPTSNVFDKSRTFEAMFPDRVYFFPEGQPAYFDDNNQDPLIAAVKWSLSREGALSYGETYTPIVFSGILETDRIVKDDVMYYASGLVSVDKAFRIVRTKGRGYGKLVEINLDIN